MNHTTNCPRVFISYSHSDHKEMVLDIVDRLRNDSVGAIVDEYDLELGHDVNLFMSFNRVRPLWHNRPTWGGWAEDIKRRLLGGFRE